MERYGLFKMSTYDYQSTVATDENGQFSFTVENGKTIQIYTRSPLTGRIGYAYVLRKVKDDRLNLAVECHERPESDFAPGPSAFSVQN